MGLNEDISSSMTGRLETDSDPHKRAIIGSRWALQDSNL